MKKQLAIAIVAIMLTAVLLVPPVMAFALWDGKSVQYSSHWSEGYNSITDKSVTASNQSIAIGNGIGARESSSWVKYYRAPVPVRMPNQPIVRGNGMEEGESIYKASLSTVMDKQSGMRVVKGKLAYADVFFVYPADGKLLYFIGADTRQILKNGTRLIDESDGSVLKGGSPRCLQRNVKVDARDLLNGTITLLP